MAIVLASLSLFSFLGIGSHGSVYIYIYTHTSVKVVATIYISMPMVMSGCANCALFCYLFSGHLAIVLASLPLFLVLIIGQW